MACTWLAWGLIITLIPGPWRSLWLSSQHLPILLGFAGGVAMATLTASKLAHGKLMTACLSFTAVVSEHLMPLTDFSPVCCSQSHMWRNTLEASSSDDNRYGFGEGYGEQQPPSQNWERNWMSRSSTPFPGSVWFVGSESQTLKARNKQAKQTPNPPS